MPVLRLRGDYLAIVTLAFGEIIRNVINCLYISLDGRRLHIAFNNPNVAGKLLVNGPAGATGVNKMATFGMGFALIALHPVRGAQPDRQPLRPGDHGHPRQPHRGGGDGA